MAVTGEKDGRPFVIERARRSERRYAWIARGERLHQPTSPSPVRFDTKVSYALGAGLHILESIAAVVTDMLSARRYASMWDRYDLRSSNDRDRDVVDDPSRGSRGGSSERDHVADRDRPDVFTKDLEVPRGRERRRVRDRDRVYEINGTKAGCSPRSGRFASSRREICRTDTETHEAACAPSNVAVARMLERADLR